MGRVLGMRSASMPAGGGQLARKYQGMITFGAPCFLCCGATIQSIATQNEDEGASRLRKVGIDHISDGLTVPSRVL